MRKIIACILAVCSVLVAVGHNPSDSVTVHFGANQGLFNPARGDMSSMDSFVDNVRMAVAGDDLSRVVIYGFSSPDGLANANERLARKRCESVAAYLMAQTGIGRDAIRIESGGVAWPELRNLVADSYDLPARGRILDILDIAALAIDDSREGENDLKRRLQELDGGEPYRWMLDRLFPQLRYVLAVCVRSGRSVRPVSAQNVAQNTAQNADPAALPALVQRAAETAAAIPAGPTVAAKRTAGAAVAASAATNHRFMLKTNTLFDVMLAPNLELEWLINDRWSLSVEENIAWWGNDLRRKSYRVSVIDSEVRRWINPLAPWHGMYVGFFAGGGWYDWWDETAVGYYGEGMLTGLTFGYMRPISKNFSLEAGIGLGYLYTRFKEYAPYDGHYLYQRTKSLNYFGPLKIKFSIGWRFSDRNRKPIESDHEQ